MSVVQKLIDAQDNQDLKAYNEVLSEDYYWLRHSTGEKVPRDELSKWLISPDAPKTELENEFKNGVRMFGYLHDNELIGVIGFQEIKDVVLIRHAYTLTQHQGKGKGSDLLKFLLEKNKNSRLLVGTWKSAKWAIKFYEKFDFRFHSAEQSALLLKKYWTIPSKQIENSVVLEKYK